MGESNTVVSAYTLYRHLQQYCSHPSICWQRRSWEIIAICYGLGQLVNLVEGPS